MSKKSSNKAVPKLNLYNVTLDWNPADAEEGDYCESVWAEDADKAIVLIAEEMAYSGEKEFDTDAERQAFIDEVVGGAGPQAAVLVARNLPREIERQLAGPECEMSPAAKKDYAKVMAILAKHGVPA